MSSTTTTTLRSLGPSILYTHQTTERTRQPNNTIIKIKVAQRSSGHRQITHITKQLRLRLLPIPQHPLPLNRLFRIRALHLLGPNTLCPELIERIKPTGHTTRNTCEPRPVSFFLHLLSEVALANARRVQVRERVAGQVESVAELTADGQEAQDWVQGAAVGCRGGGAEVLDKLAEAEGFADEAEVRFEGGEEVDGCLGVVCSEEVPGEEAGEVLDGAEGFVAADLGNGLVGREVVREWRVTYLLLRRTCCSASLLGGR